MNADRSGSDAPRQSSVQDDHVLSWCLEQAHWSREAHEKEWCRDALYFYLQFKNYIDNTIDPDDYRSNIGLGILFPTIKIMSAKLR